MAVAGGLLAAALVGCSGRTLLNPAVLALSAVGVAAGGRVVGRTKTLPLLAGVGVGVGVGRVASLLVVAGLLIERFLPGVWYAEAAAALDAAEGRVGVFGLLWALLGGGFEVDGRLDDRGMEGWLATP